MKERDGIERTVREIQGFRERSPLQNDAGKLGPSCDAGMDPQERGGEGGLLISYARATRGLRRPSLDARSGRSSRPHSREEKANELGGII